MSYVVWGAGGHGRVVADVVRALGIMLSAFADRDEAAAAVAAARFGVASMPERDLSRGTEREPMTPQWSRVVLGIGDNATRQHCVVLGGSHIAPPLVHPTAFVAGEAVLGIGTVVMPKAVINTDAAVGAAVVINTSAIVEHDCTLADAVHVAPGAILCGGVSVGERSLVGAGAVILPGITIGADCRIGAGAVVTRNVREGVTVVGVPARVAASCVVAERS
jgi:sugar O-acyltransferase (sialic acid O-acetyltransferase NeuD family)